MAPTFSNLSDAVTGCDFELVRKILDSGLDINCRNSFSRTVLHCAAAKLITCTSFASKGNGDQCIERLIVDFKADVNAVDLRGLTPLHYACERCFSEEARENYTGPENGKELDDIIEERQFKAVDLLCRHGADVNAKCVFDLTSLHRAVQLGDKRLIKKLVALGVDINECKYVNFTIQHLVVMLGNASLLDHLRKNETNANPTYDLVASIHEVVRDGDVEMVQFLAELRADMNLKEKVGQSLLHLAMTTIQDPEQKMAIIKVLRSITSKDSHETTPIHEAVRLGDVRMVKALWKLKADMNCGRNEGVKPIHIATTWDMSDEVGCLVQMGADVSESYTDQIRPLHDAVRCSNVEMVKTLMKCGADPYRYKEIYVTALAMCVHTGNTEMVNFLISHCKANVNAKTSIGVGALYEAIESEHTGIDMIKALTEEPDNPRLAGRQDYKTEDVYLLTQSIIGDRFDITETLLKHGANVNCHEGRCFSPDAVAFKAGKDEYVRLLLEHFSLPNRFDLVGSSPLHRACQLGLFNQVRLLIFNGADVNRKDDYHKMKPLEHLPLADKVDYHVLKETLVAKEILERIQDDSVSTAGCQDMTKLLNTPGIGDVKKISSPSSEEISEKFLRHLRTNTPESELFPGGKWKPVGSSAEGTRVGLPNEMDFLFEVERGQQLEIKKPVGMDGYVYYDNADSHSELLFHSSYFHSKFMEIVGTGFVDEVVIPLNSGGELKSGMLRKWPVRQKDRKACSNICLHWQKYGGNGQFYIPVDLVPSVHIKGWPEGGATKTWLMKESELRSCGYVLVVKPPHVKSDVAKKCTKDQLQSLWKISFPHLETEHMQRLEQRIKNVYLTAKCLRDPDACRIMITDDGSSPKNVDKFLTSYLLKMCFFKNVEHFIQNDLSLEYMVCKVYQDLADGLSEGFIPLFFLPKVSALCGTNLDVPKCAKVAKVMLRFVKALYQRDCAGDKRAGAADQKLNYVYRTYELNRL